MKRFKCCKHCPPGCAWNDVGHTLACIECDKTALRAETR